MYFENQFHRFSLKLFYYQLLPSSYIYRLQLMHLCMRIRRRIYLHYIPMYMENNKCRCHRSESNLTACDSQSRL